MRDELVFADVAGHDVIDVRAGEAAQPPGRAAEPPGAAEIPTATLPPANDPSAPKVANT